jgi:hypothetical protein
MTSDFLFDFAASADSISAQETNMTFDPIIIPIIRNGGSGG